MSGTEQPTFSSLVFGKAISETRQFFGSKPRDLALATVSIATGFGLYWYFQGWPVAMEQFASVAAFTLAPLGLVLLAVFFWNLWLAPAALAYEAAKAISTHQSIEEIRLETSMYESVNWAIWKQRSSYRITEFASILAEIDPNTLDTAEVKAFLSLLKEEVSGGKLKAARRKGFETGQYSVMESPSVYEISKSNALAWAKAKNFDVSHIE
jgi:hypothetical protein